MFFHEHFVSALKYAALIKTDIYTQPADTAFVNLQFPKGFCGTVWNLHPVAGSSFMSSSNQDYDILCCNAL
jgi:hypothetical protein